MHGKLTARDCFLGILQAIDTSAAELARRPAVPTNRVTVILNGGRGITGDTALRLPYFFGASAEFWLNPQSLYDLRLTPQKVGGYPQPPSDA